MSIDEMFIRAILGIEESRVRTIEVLKENLKIECISKDFNLLIDVIFCSQYGRIENSGLRASKLFGRTQSIAIKPTYCLFIANLLPARAVAHFFNLNRFKTAAYGGQTSIVPVELSVFRAMLLKAKDENLQDSRYLQEFLEKMVQHGRDADDENEWLETIQRSAKDWCIA